MMVVKLFSTLRNSSKPVPAPLESRAVLWLRQAQKQEEPSNLFVSAGKLLGLLTGWRIKVVGNIFIGTNYCLWCRVYLF